MARQYTLRAVPAVIDQELRRRAKEQHKSLNSVTLEYLARGLELEAVPSKFTDLDGLIGSWQEDPGFDQAVADFGRVDQRA